MNFHILTELLLLQFNNCERSTEKFIESFNYSSNIAIFNLDFVNLKILQASSLFQKLNSPQSLPITLDSKLFKRFIHHEDLDEVMHYFTSIVAECDSAETVFSEKCRIKVCSDSWQTFHIVPLLNLKTNCCTSKSNVMVLMVNSESSCDNPLCSVDNESKCIENDMKTIPVSHREKQILHLLGKGLVAKQIAEVLHISPTTVISHKKNLINKFQVKNSVELICLASKQMNI